MNWIKHKYIKVLKCNKKCSSIVGKCTLKPVNVLHHSKSTLCRTLIRGRSPFNSNKGWFMILLYIEPLFIFIVLQIIQSVFFYGCRHLQILYPPLHWIHAELAGQPAGLWKRRREGSLKPYLPGDRVPPPPSPVLPGLQRRQHQAHWVCHSLCNRRQVHFYRPTVSFQILNYLHLHELLFIFLLWVVDFFWNKQFRWERSGRGVLWWGGRWAYRMNFVRSTVSGDNPFCLCPCFSEGAVQLDGITWKSLLNFWKVISQHKYSESFPQISHMCECWMIHVERLVYTVFVFVSFSLVTFCDRHSPEKAAGQVEKGCKPKLPVCLLSFLEPRLSLVICRRRF